MEINVIHPGCFFLKRKLSEGIQLKYQQDNDVF